MPNDPNVPYDLKKRITTLTRPAPAPPPQRFAPARDARGALQVGAYDVAPASPEGPYRSADGPRMETQGDRNRATLARQQEAAQMARDEQRAAAEQRVTAVEQYRTDMRARTAPAPRPASVPAPAAAERPLGMGLPPDAGNPALGAAYRAAGVGASGGTATGGLPGFAGTRDAQVDRIDAILAEQGAAPIPRTLRRDGIASTGANVIRRSVGANGEPVFEMATGAPQADDRVYGRNTYGGENYGDLNFDDAATYERLAQAGSADVETQRRDAEFERRAAVARGTPRFDDRGRAIAPESMDPATLIALQRLQLDAANIGSQINARDSAERRLSAADQRAADEAARDRTQAEFEQLGELAASDNPVDNAAFRRLVEMRLAAAEQQGPEAIAALEGDLVAQFGQDIAATFFQPEVGLIEGVFQTPREASRSNLTLTPDGELGLLDDDYFTGSESFSGALPGMPATQRSLQREQQARILERERARAEARRRDE